MQVGNKNSRKLLVFHLQDGGDMDLGGPAETSEAGGYPFPGLSLKATYGRGHFPMEISIGDREIKPL